MTQAELDHFRERLEQERSVLLKHLDGLGEQMAEDNQVDETLADDNDAATRAIDLEELSTERAHLGATLTQIDQALARIAAGNYGYSEVSGKPIPLERLEALPYATKLVDE